MMIPSVHLNGTSGKNLLAEVRTAHDALQIAIDAMREITVHGRDYYVQGQHAYGQARAEMDVRLDTLNHLRGDLEEMYEKIEAQIPEHKR